MPEYNRSHRERTKRGSSNGNRSHSRTDTEALEAKLKKVNLSGDGHKSSRPGGRALTQPQVHKAAPKKMLVTGKIQAYLHQQRVIGLSKSRPPRFLYDLAAAEQMSRGSGAPGSGSGGFNPFGLGGSNPAGRGPGAQGPGRNNPPNMTIPMPITDVETFRMTSYEANYIDGLQIWRIRSNGQPECLSPGQPRFDIMAAAIMLGFDIMQSQPWRRKMRAHANDMFSHIQDTESLPLPPGRIWTDTAIENYIEDFIRRCRQNSPIAVLNNLGNAQWARTTKSDWSGRGSFNPQVAAIVEYNIQIIDRIDDAAIAFTEARRRAKRYAEQRNSRDEEQEIKKAKLQLHKYHSMMVRIAMTVAHEMEHVFTGYMLRDPLAHTPPNVTYGGYGDDLVGESGRFVEGGVFGGFVEMKFEVATDMEVIAVRTYAQTFLLSSDQVNAIIKRQWAILPTYDPEGDSYEGPPRVTPPKKIDLEKWTDELRYRYIFSGRKREPELSRTLNLNLRQGLYGGRLYRLRCKSLREYSEDPRTKIEVLGEYHVIVAGVQP